MKINSKMKTRLKAASFILLACIFIPLTACEDVIDINLNNSDPKVVLEGYINDDPEYAVFQISKSTDYFSPGDIPVVNDAEVIISDDDGNVDTLAFVSDGLYISYDVEAEVGKEYTASVVVEGITYTASATMQAPMPIDSMLTEYQEGGGFGNDEDEGYRLHIFFNDPEGIDNFNRFKITVNDTILDDIYYLYDDEFSDGNVIDYSWFFRVFQPGDFVEIEFLSMDEQVYDFFRTAYFVRATEEAGEGPEITPANPLTNWDNDALGYFGAFAIQYDTLLIVAGDSP